MDTQTKKINVFVWKDDQWVSQSIVPKIFIPESNVLYGKQIDQLKVTKQNISVYNSPNEIEHRKDLRYGKKDNDPLSMELRTLNDDIPNHTDLQIDPLTGECAGGNTTLTVAEQIWRDKKIPIDKRKISAKYAPYTFVGAPEDEVQKVLIRLNTVGKRDEDSVPALYDRTIPIILTGMKKYGYYNYRNARWKFYLEDFINSYRSDVLSIKKINLLWKVYNLPESKSKKDLLVDMTDYSWKELTDALDKIERESNKKVVNPSRPDFLEIIREEPNLKQNLKKAFFKCIKDVNNLFDNDITNPEYGLKKSSISTIMSHLLMYRLCKVWNNLGKEKYHCTTEAAVDTRSEKEKVIPDLKFTYMTDQAKNINPNFEDVTQEVKFSMSDYPMGSTCLYYGGPGLRFMNETYYYCATISNDLKKGLLFFTELDKFDVSTRNTFTLNNIVRRRLWDNDFEFIAGNFNFDKKSRRYKFEGEEVK